MKNEYHMIFMVSNIIDELLHFMYTSFSCEAVGLAFFSTSSQVEGLHCDTVGYFSS